MMGRFLVYADALEDRQVVKIGVCFGNLYNRRNKRNTDCPFEMELLGVIQYPNKQEMIDAESAIHKRFAEYNSKGEWFSWNVEIEAYIQAHFDKELGERILKEDCENLREHQKEYQKEYHRKYKRDRRKDIERYNNDPDYRKRQQEYCREYHRKRHQSDPDYRKRRREYNKERQRKLCKDPEYLDRKRQSAREHYHRKKRKKQQINGQQLSFF